MFNNQVPYLPQMAQPAVQQSTEIKWIQGGKQSAMAYPVMPGSKVLLFDSEVERFYLKEVAFNGVPMPLREFKYTEVIEEAPVTKEPPDPDAYLTREEFENTMKQINERLNKMNRKGYNKHEQSVSVTKSEPSTGENGFNKTV